MFEASKEGLEGGDAELPEGPQVKGSKGRCRVCVGECQGLPKGVSREGE